VLLALAGCGPKPDSVALQLLEAINAQKMDAALSLFASNAVVSVDGSAPFSGKREIQVWLESLKANNVQLEQGEILEQDEKSFRAHYSLMTTRAIDLGVAPLEGTGEITTRRGKIDTLSFILSEESQAELLMATFQQNIDTTVLSYVVLTDPDPIGARQEDKDANEASLTVAITNETGSDVKVRRISLHFKDLISDINGVQLALSDFWKQYRVGGFFIIEPHGSNDGRLAPGKGLYINFTKIKINNQPGMWVLEIDEETGEDTTHSMTIQMVKSPFVFYVSDLTADPLVIDPGENTTLTWNGSSTNGATYELRYSGEIISVNPTGSLSVKLNETTTFYLVARLKGIASPVIRERTVTVIK
jgi:hypothetical protein